MPTFLYIDPGTGSMLFTIILGLMGGVFYFFRSLKVKLKYNGLGLGRKEKSAEKIPLVIFSDHKRYWNIFKPVCDELEKRGIRTLYLTGSSDDPALEQNYDHIETGYYSLDKTMFQTLNSLEAKIVLSTTPSLDVFQWKRSPGVDYYIHIPHAASDLSMYRMFGIDYYDAILLSGQFQEDQVRSLENLRNLPAKDLRYVGIPYLDSMKDRLIKADRSSDQDLPDATKAAETTILVAPSWGESSLLARFGEALLDRLIQTGYNIIVRPHPQSFFSEKPMLDRLMDLFPESDRLSWNRDQDNFFCLAQSDLLISDFSGIIFDYCLVFDKPILYTEVHYDTAPYDCWWLDEEPWTFRALPSLGQVLTEDNFDRVEKIIEDLLENPTYQAQRDLVRQESWAFPGQGAERTVDFIEEKLEDLDKADSEASQQAKQSKKKGEIHVLS